MSIDNNFLAPRIISPAKKSTSQDAILPWHCTSTRCHLIFSVAHALVQAGFGGGSSVLLITVELGSASLWERKQSQKEEAYINLGAVFENKQKIQQAYIPKEILRNIEPNVYQ